MNKTESISIGRRPFVCDVDAYEVIRAYLQRAHKRLANDPDRDEILSDLEQAMSTHLTDLSGELVVDKVSAQKVIALMGEVEVDSDQASKEGTETTEDATSFTERLGLLFKKTPQKDRSRAIIEGVCAGIAKLLMIDPFWVRLVFIVFTLLSQGLGILVYIVLALIMHDEQDDYVGKTAGEVIGTVKERAKVGFSQSARRYELVLSRIIRRIIRVLLAVCTIALLLMLIALGALWSTLLFFMITNPNRIVLFGENPSLLDFTVLVSTGVVLLIPILLLILQLAGSRLVRNVRANVIFGCIWVISIMLAAGSATNVIPNVRDRLERETPVTKNVVVEASDGTILHSCFTLWGDCRDDRPEIYTTTVCGQEVSMVEMTETTLTRMHSWSWNYRSTALESPMTERIYCDFVRSIIRQHTAERVVLSDQDWNDESYLETISLNPECSISSNSLRSESGVDVEGAPEINKDAPAGQSACPQQTVQPAWWASYFVR